MQLIPIDTTNQEHINFTYEILCARFGNKYVNIDAGEIPTIEQHKKLLESDRYLYYYIIQFNNVNVGIQYIIREKNEIGYLLHLKNAVSVYKKNKHTFSEEEKGIIVGNQRVKKMFYFFGDMAFKLLLDMHPDLTEITSRVNYYNHKSAEGTEFGYGFKPKYIYYEFKR
jgi:hypothetical protein